MFNKQAIYNVGIYLRISKDDGDDVESESISNQRKIIKDYISKNENMKIYNEYIDDGYSGANFNRPNFKKMINDIQNKKINMVITKNLARLGRNYIETGAYIEKYFPDHRVRYIAILDNIDNFNESVSYDFMPIKSVFNEKHCRDTSIAVKKTKRKKMAEGYYACNTAPFGYKKDPNNPGKLIIDEISSKTVKKIFSLKENGYTINDIVKYLDDNDYMTPAEYLNIRGLEKIENKNIWRSSTVKRILSNKVYLGHCIRGKTQNISYKSKDRIHVKRNDFIITPNTHEPIITEELFNKIHNTKKYGLTIEREDTHYLLKDLLYCKKCGKKLIFKKSREKVKIYCRSNNENEKICSNNSIINYCYIENKIVDYITNMYKRYLNNNINKDNLYKRIYENNINDLEKSFKDLKQELGKITFKITSLYNDRLLGKIEEDIYIERYNSLSKQRKEIEEKTKNKEIEINNKKEQITNFELKEQILKKIQSLEKKDLNNSILKELISKIELYKNEVTINFNFSETDKFCV